MKAVREQMLKGEEPLACANCYRQERVGAESFRISKNYNISESNLDWLLASTDSDGTLHNFKMQYWDARFSNVCNLKCRMCGPGYSHTWAQELNTKVNGSYIIQAHDTDVWSDIIAKYGDLSELKEVYFAGGEVFFQQEHWQMLEHLKQLGMRDIRLTYVTNLTRLSMGTYRIQDYLAYFTNVLFIVSMDGIDSVFEYIRSGGDWKRFVTNLEVIKQYPVRIRFNIVVTIYNILSLNQVFDFIDSNGFDKYDLSIANYPEDQNIVNLPQELKILATQRLTKYPRAQSVINYMNQPAIVAWDKVVSQTTQLDQTRKESILKIIPEFTPYWK